MTDLEKGLNVAATVIFENTSADCQVIARAAVVAFLRVLPTEALSKWVAVDEGKRLIQRPVTTKELANAIERSAVP